MSDRCSWSDLDCGGPEGSSTSSGSSSDTSLESCPYRAVAIQEGQRDTERARNIRLLSRNMRAWLVPQCPPRKRRGKKHHQRNLSVDPPHQKMILLRPLEPQTPTQNHAKQPCKGGPFSPIGSTTAPQSVTPSQ